MVQTKITLTMMKLLPEEDWKEPEISLISQPTENGMSLEKMILMELKIKLYHRIELK